MSKTRLEAFSDGVIAIIITIMVLELRPPEGTNAADLLSLLPVFLSYVLSFVFVGVYWNNHHHLLHTCQRVTGKVLWANMFLLFWLSLIPFVTAWMGEHELTTWPVALYGAVCWMSGIAYYILSRTIIAADGARSVLATAVGRDAKGLISLVLYTVAIVAAFIVPVLSIVLYAATAGLWFIPDRRIERRVSG
jgi:uncharacterized membrane protein